MNAIIQFLIIFFSVSFASGQLSKCDSDNEWNVKHSKHIERGFLLSNFLKPALPSKTQLGSHYLGKGAFGSVYNYELLAKDNKTKIPAAIKIIKYNQKTIPHLNKELEILQKFSKDNPLEFVRYFGCIQSDASQRAFIFQEKLSGDLGNKDFKKDTFNKYNFLQKLGVFLMMARSIQRLHELKHAHLDIKPENFMMLIQDPPIIKPIDFGLSKRIGETFYGGTDAFMDPCINKSKEVDGEEYKVHPKSDVFSLGYTFEELLYTFSGVPFERSCSHSYLSSLQCNMNRLGMIKQAHDIIEGKIHQQYRPLMADVHSLIRDMVAPNIEERESIDHVVSELNRILSTYDSNSIYLNKNINKLRSISYPAFDDTNTPLIEEDPSADQFKKPAPLNRTKSNLGASSFMKTQSGMKNSLSRNIKTSLVSSLSQQNSIKGSTASKMMEKTPRFVGNRQKEPVINTSNISSVSKQNSIKSSIVSRGMDMTPRLKGNRLKESTIKASNISSLSKQNSLQNSIVSRIADKTPKTKVPLKKNSEFNSTLSKKNMLNKVLSTFNNKKKNETDPKVKDEKRALIGTPLHKKNESPGQTDESTKTISNNKETTTRLNTLNYTPDSGIKVMVNNNSFFSSDEESPVKQNESLAQSLIQGLTGTINIKKGNTMEEEVIDKLVNEPEEDEFVFDDEQENQTKVGENKLKSFKTDINNKSQQPMRMRANALETVPEVIQRKATFKPDMSLKSIDNLEMEENNIDEKILIELKYDQLKKKAKSNMAVIQELENKKKEEIMTLNRKRAREGANNLLRRTSVKQSVKNFII